MRAPTGTVTVTRQGRFQVRITHLGRRVSCGVFATREEAEKARASEVHARARETERRKRASGTVYFVEAIGAGAVKIGYTATPVRQRVHGMQANCPHSLRVLGTMVGDEHFEHELHRRFGRFRLRGEWFELTPEIRSFVDAAREGG
jgi:hypothetical protein